MRLSKSEIKTIKRVTCEVWGSQTHIYLFGSRTDDSKKGGDIDLFINLQEEQVPKEIMLKKTEFLGKLDLLLGEQKIDLLVSTHYNNHLSIIKTALLTGVEL
jgi:predicted nucleotidyltransferase